jgi:hypothetical protein
LNIFRNFPSVSFDKKNIPSAGALKVFFSRVMYIPDLCKMMNRSGLIFREMMDEKKIGFQKYAFSRIAPK